VNSHDCYTTKNTTGQSFVPNDNSVRINVPPREQWRTISDHNVRTVGRVSGRIPFESVRFEVQSGNKGFRTRDERSRREFVFCSWKRKCFRLSDDGQLLRDIPTPRDVRDRSKENSSRLYWYKYIINYSQARLLYIN